MRRHPDLDWSAVDDVLFGCANQAGEDNRNVARMAALLSGLPLTVPGATVNRLCGSGMDAVGSAARAIRAGDTELMIAGGVESMTRAPFVMGKADAAFSRNAQIFDTTIGWRFVNPLMKKLHGTDAMPETAENLADELKISRADQDAFALRSQQRAVAAQAAGRFDDEIVPVEIAQKKGDPKIIAADEHPRADTSLESLAKLKPIVREDGTVTAGNASGVNDGACALLLARGAAKSTA
jgi:acetyl-CoA C-acetyltransferase